jgi:hypothetical protein
MRHVDKSRLVTIIALLRVTRRMRLQCTRAAEHAGNTKESTSVGACIPSCEICFTDLTRRAIIRLKILSNTSNKTDPSSGSTSWAASQHLNLRLHITLAAPRMALPATMRDDGQGRTSQASWYRPCRSLQRPKGQQCHATVSSRLFSCPALKIRYRRLRFSNVHGISGLDIHSKASREAIPLVSLARLH